MSKEVLVCPWRAEQCVKTLWSAVGAIKHDDWTVAHCIKEKCAMWGEVERYEAGRGRPASEGFLVYGCRRRG